MLGETLYGDNVKRLKVKLQQQRYFIKGEQRGNLKEIITSN